MRTVKDIRHLAEAEAKRVAGSPRDWMGYLNTAARLYRYPFPDALLIHAQRPDASACASMELWNRKMNRWVNRGAKGIALIDDTGPKMRLKYVFDISDTHMEHGGRTPHLWQIKEAQMEAVLSHLVEAYGLPEGDAASLPFALSTIAHHLANENLEEALDGLLLETEGTFLEGMDEESIRSGFRNLLMDSAFYVLFVRCGLDPMEFLEEEDFSKITDYNALSVLAFLGNAVSQLVEPVLVDIGRTVRRVLLEEFQKTVAKGPGISYNEFSTLIRESEKEEGGNGNGIDLPPKRGLPVSEPGHRGTGGDHREIRDAAPELLKGEPEELVSEHDAVGETEQTSHGDREGSRGEDGNLDGEVTPEIPGTGQGERSDGVGRAYERADGDGGRERLEGIGVQLKEDTTEQDLSEAEEETASALFLPDLPTVKQQKRKIEERMQALYAGEISIPSDVLDEVIRNGGNRNGSQLRIIYNFMVDQSPEEYTEFVRREYGQGGIGLVIKGKEYSVWYDELGMQVAVGYTVTDRILDKAFLSWDEVSGRIHQLLKQGEYAPQAVLDAARENALKEHATALAFMKKDMADGVAELVFDDMEVFQGGYPEIIERLAERIAQPEYLTDLIERLEGLVEAYKEDSDIMRFSFYEPPKVLAQFEKFAKDAVPYEAREGFAWEKHPVFITEDEIDAFLQGGGPYSDGRLSTYAFFIQDKTDKEKTKFIKERYGVGGRSHALSGADYSDAWYDGKGLKLSRGSLSESEAEVLLKWPKVAKRVDALIRNGNYLKPGDYSRMPIYERECMAGRVANFYSNLPDEIVRPFKGSTFQTETRELQALLENPDTANKLLMDMDAALVSLPPDFEDYEKRIQILIDIHGYVDGTYMIFPEKWQESQVENSGQLSLFDFMDASVAEPEPQKIENEKEWREGIRRDQTVQEEPDSGEASLDESRLNQALEPAAENETGQVIGHRGIQEKANFRITDDDLGAGGSKQKFRANMDAVLLLKKLETENRFATPEEQEILSRFVGWGGIPAVFDDKNEAWAGEQAELKQVLTAGEYREARASTLNAFYTSPAVIKVMYEVLGNLGLWQGNVLEPSCGTGNFMGLVPEVMDGLKMYGVEIDSISGKIAKQLYQKNNISIQGFETTEFPDSFFDCVIGNVPFGAYKVPDRKYDRYNFMIHDYFIAKSLDLVRPGGVVAVVTSSRTMDKQNPSVRQYIANRADLLGAIRLPNNAFLRNAGTEVVADILFFQKRDRASLEQPGWVELGTIEEGYSVNSYFVQHPEMVLGEFTVESTQYGKQEVTVRPRKGAILSEQLREAAGHIKGTIMEIDLADSELEEAEIFIPADPSVKNFSFANVDGKVYYRENSRMNRMELPRMTTERVLGMIELRDLTQQLLQCQMEDGSDEEVSMLQQKLNIQYDRFTAQYGLISSNANRKAFSQDSSYCLLASLEILDEDGNLKRKADIFTKRTIRKAVAVENVDTASEALAVSMGERAKVDVPFMAQLSGKTEEEVTKELEGVIFKNPLTNRWETSDEYLSGNVREKLAIAKQFSESSPEYGINVQALERVQPKDLEASEIEVRLGATWVDASYIQEFMAQLLHTPKHLLGRQIKVTCAKINGQWNISGKSVDVRGNSLVTSTYGTQRANAYRLLEDALNLRDTKIYDTVDEDGVEKRVLNKKETLIAQQKQEMIKEAFKEWIFQDLARREDLCRKYNDLYNSIRPCKHRIK